MTDYWYPRDYDKYIKSDHYKDRLLYRKIPEELAIEAVEWGDFFPCNEEGVMGFRSEVEGVAVIVIASGKSMEGHENVAITSWPYVVDSVDAYGSDIWTGEYVDRVKEDTEEYVEKVDGDTPAPPGYAERVEA